MTKLFYKLSILVLFVSTFSVSGSEENSHIVQPTIKRKYKHDYPIEERLRSIEISKGSFRINQNLNSDLSFSNGFNLWRTHLVAPGFYYAINNRINIGLDKLPRIGCILIGAPRNNEFKPFQLSASAGLHWIYSDFQSRYFWDHGIIFEHSYSLKMKSVFSEKRWTSLDMLFNLYNNKIADIVITPLMHRQITQSISMLYGISWQQAHYFGKGDYDEFFADVFRIHLGGKFNIGRVFSIDLSLAPGYETDRGYFFVSANGNINFIW